MKRLTDKVLREAVAHGTNVARRECKRLGLPPYCFGEPLELMTPQKVSEHHVLAMRKTLEYLGVAPKAGSTKGNA